MFDRKAYEKEKKEKEGRKEKKRKEKAQPNKPPKIAISVACILIRRQPLPNNISTENGKNDELYSLNASAKCHCFGKAIQK